jgi:hypothetical protein
MTHRLDTLLERLREEGGSAVLTAVVLLTIMVSTSLALLAYVDTETKQGQVGRSRETAFNFAEAAMHGQIFSLSKTWPANPGIAYPQCLAATGTDKCPSDSQLRGLFPSADTDATTQWSTQVIDNQPPYATFYSDAMLSGTTYGWDRGGKDGATTPDKQVWVRVQARSRGKTRTLVALVRAEEQQEDIVNTGLLAGRLNIKNNGKRVKIDGSGGGKVEVRCQVDDGICLGHALDGGIQDVNDLNDLLNYQLNPNQTQTGSTTVGMSMDSTLRLRATAQANGTLYTSCPPTLAGEVVWLEKLTCDYSGNVAFNSPSQPGMVILNGGKLSLGGNTRYYGVLYYTNLDGVSSIPATTVIDLGGTTLVSGGIVVEGAGMVSIGSSSSNQDGPDAIVRFDANAFAHIRSIGSAGIVQNTWRELTPR